MDDLKKQIQMFFKELEFTHLKKLWVERLMTFGVDEEEAGLWAVEIGHVVDEYQSTLIRLADLLQETNVGRIRDRVYNWAVGISEVTISEIQEPMQYLAGQLEKYQPPEPEDDEEDET